MVVFDTSVLILLLKPNASGPLDPATGQPIEKVRERIEHLIDTLTRDRQKIMIPTPVLSEILVHAGAAGPEWIRCFNKSSAFRIVDFDQKAAIEAARSIRDSLDRGGIKVDSTDASSSRGKVKFDRQIVAIAKAEEATVIYSDDADVIKYARDAGLCAYRTGDLELPPDDSQLTIELDDETGEE